MLTVFLEVTITFLVRFQLAGSLSQLVLQLQTNFVLKLVILVFVYSGLYLTLLADRWTTKFGDEFFESRFFCSCESACITCTFTTLLSDHLMIQYFGEALASSRYPPLPTLFGCGEFMSGALLEVNVKSLSGCLHYDVVLGQRISYNACDTVQNAVHEV